jgi:hypothetical protein
VYEFIDEGKIIGNSDDEWFDEIEYNTIKFNLDRGLNYIKTFLYEGVRN